MFRNITQNRGHLTLVLLLILGVVTGSLIIDTPVPTQETEAGWTHKCANTSSGGMVVNGQPSKSVNVPFISLGQDMVTSVLSNPHG